MARRFSLAIVLCLLAAACTLTPNPSPASQAVETPVPELPPTPALADVSAPQGWSTYRNEELAFGFAYPASGVLAPGEGDILATIGYTPDPTTNVLEETILVSGLAGVETCISPLAQGWAPGELAPETVEVNGVSFLRQMHSGVAAGTSAIWVAYTTQQNERCASLGYVLRTFDPANLDPTRFPTPPAAVDWRSKAQGFEAMMATFTWLR